MRRMLASSALTSGILLGLLAVVHLTPLLPHGRASRFMRNAVGISRGRNPNKWNWHIIRDQNTGYYEQLLTGSAQEQGGGPLLARLRNRKAGRPVDPSGDPYERGSYLCYEPKPHLNWHGQADPKELVTNSFGLADQEYAHTKPAGTRRAVLIGDSLSRGYGVPVGERFETRFENQLNAATLHHSGERFEVLNFGVDGYRITQLFDVSLGKAASFQADVYLVMLTEVSVAPNWGSHLAQLVHEGIDLKYGFLRETWKASGLRKEDDWAMVQAKLAPFRVQVLREVLRRIQAHAQRNSANLVVVLVPAAEDATLIRHRFEGVRDLVSGLGIPVIDVLDTFDSVEDVETVRTAWYDLHPNSEGHRRIADNLYRKFTQQPDAWETLTGYKMEPIRAGRSTKD